MFEVPMFIWSKIADVTATEKLVASISKPFVLDGIFDSVLEVMGFPVCHFNQKRSVFSLNYDCKTRVFYGKGFDEYFSEK